MSDQMWPLTLQQLTSWIFNEYKYSNSVFGIPEEKWFRYKKHFGLDLFNKKLEAPVGPAAGPHTQMSQNIISAYLTGSRFFELKTVQIMDEIKIDKPCIEASDEGYNVEWSQELKLNQSYDEYVKAWIIIHMLNEYFHFAEKPDIIFNMSIGYDLKGIKSESMTSFIDGLIESATNESFNMYKEYLKGLDKIDARIIDQIPSKISNSVTLSTMHGCPPDEIESIIKYLIKEKKLNTYVKLNPTLLRYDLVQDILVNAGYNYVQLSRDSFDHDLQMEDATAMLLRLKDFAKEHNRQFGIKLSNTLGVNNIKGALPGDQMYMSGRAIFPLTINLAARLASELKGDIKISFSGGASVYNTAQILSTGIFPVTYATELLKPGGYFRLKKIAESISDCVIPENINTAELTKLAAESLTDQYYRKNSQKPILKMNKQLPKFDCYISPCSEACPIHQDISEYIHLINEKRYADALEVIYFRNPLPHITGYICDHMCESKCTRWDYDSPVRIRELKKFAAEKGYNVYIERYTYPDKKNKSRIAIIGAGPAGLTSAYFLAKAGLDVTVFDKENSAGGTVRYVIPGFRLPQSAIDKDIDFIEHHGVKFVFNSEYDFSIYNLKSNGYKYIIIAIGAGISKIPVLKGTNINRYEAIEFLRSFNKNQQLKPGKNIAVIGGGNTAMDSARAAKRCKGVEKVYIVYRRTKEYMPADMEEFDAAIEDGIIFRELLSPVEFSGTLLKCAKIKLGNKDNDGRRKAEVIESEYEIIEIDSVIFATGEEVDYELLSKNNISVKGTVGLVDNIYITGDALRGPATVVKAIADGKAAAESIMTNENISFYYMTKHLNRNEKDIMLSKGVIHSAYNNPVKEASRCLQCNVLCNKCVEVCPNRANLIVKSGEGMKDKYQIVHIDDLCNECGNCETFCPYEGKPYKDKFTISFSDDIFDPDALTHMNSIGD